MLRSPAFNTPLPLSFYPVHPAPHLIGENTPHRSPNLPYHVHGGFC
jgi:hypothetical protein